MQVTRRTTSCKPKPKISAFWQFRLVICGSPCDLGFALWLGFQIFFRQICTRTDVRLGFRLATCGSPCDLCFGLRLMIQFETQVTNWNPSRKAKHKQELVHFLHRFYVHFVRTPSKSRCTSNFEFPSKFVCTVPFSLRQLSVTIIHIAYNGKNTNELSMHVYNARKWC